MERRIFELTVSEFLDILKQGENVSPVPEQKTAT